jgi:hypothetical protein
VLRLSDHAPVEAAFTPVHRSREHLPG